MTLGQTLMLTAGQVLFVIQPTPERIDDPRLTESVNLLDVAHGVVESVSRLKMDAGLL